MTAGEIAFAAFWQTLAQTLGTDSDEWNRIHPGTQRAWEAAAQAVLAAQAPPPPLTVLELYEAMGEAHAETPPASRMPDSTPDRRNNTGPPDPAPAV